MQMDKKGIVNRLKDFRFTSVKTKKKQ